MSLKCDKYAHMYTHATLVRFHHASPGLPPTDDVTPFAGVIVIYSRDTSRYQTKTSRETPAVRRSPPFGDAGCGAYNSGEESAATLGGAVARSTASAHPPPKA